MTWQNGSSTEEKVWIYLIEECGLTKAGAAGVLGNMANESWVRPTTVQRGYGWTDEGYTSAVDSGSYSNFVYDSIGYGLVQFTYWSLKKIVYDNAKSSGKSVGDLEVQLRSVKQMLEQSYQSLHSILKSSNDVRTCCVQFLLQYERPADQSQSVQDKRTASAQQYYDQFQNLSTSGGSSSSSSGGWTISYDRSKDPLMLEFGYVRRASESEADLGTTLKAQKEWTKYPVSAINQADLLNDVFDIWGFSMSNGSSSSSGTQKSGQATMKSGKVVTFGTYKEMPSGQAQTGIIANFTGYVRNWAQGTTQRTIYNEWNNQGRPSSYSIATVSGYYLIAPGRYFSNSAGDILEFELEDGTKFQCMVADTKGSDTGNEYGHLFGGAADVIEWENCSTSQSNLASGLKSWGIYGKKVKGAINYGTWFQ